VLLATNTALTTIVAAWPEGRTDVRWHSGQETSLAPPCSNPRSFGGKCTALKKVGYLQHCWDFSATGALYFPPVPAQRRASAEPSLRSKTVVFRLFIVIRSLLPENQDFNQPLFKKITIRSTVKSNCYFRGITHRSGAPVLVKSAKQGQ